MKFSKSFFFALVCALGLGSAFAQSPAPAPAPAAKANAAAGQKVLRYAYPIAETGFDPAQLSDLYSRIITSNIFDSLYGYDYLARPAKSVPNVAAAMPEVSNDFKVWTVRIKPGVYFTDDPAFKGKKRELTAQDFVYSFKRLYDPKNKSPSMSSLNDDKILGLEDLRKKATAGGKFDYDSEVEGLRALDRYTIQFTLAEPRPRFIYTLADGSILGAVAREVVEHYGDKIMEHPVGTGPFKLGEWKRSSKITLLRNPGFREVIYEGTPNAGDARAQAIHANLKGKRLPILDRVEISIIEEAQPRWLAFLGNEHDFLERLPNPFANQAIPNNKLAPNLVKKGITMDRTPLADVTISYFAMEHPVVGGYTPDKVALRRAIALAYNTDEEIRLPRRNQAIAAQGPVQPQTYGYDPKFKSEMSEFDRAKAVALLDLYGYTDKNGDGWRDLPDGKPLVLEYATSPDNASRELNEIWKKNLDAIKVKVEFKVGKWPEQLKASRAGKLMMWGFGMSASTPDGAGILEIAYGPSSGQQNHARFKLAAFDALYNQQKFMPDGPERIAVMQEAAKLLIAYMPYKLNTHRIATDLMQPWVKNYLRHPVNSREYWKYVDIDTSLQPK